MFAGEPDQQRTFRLPSSTFIDGSEKCLAFTEIIRRFEVG